MKNLIILFILSFVLSISCTKPNPNKIENVTTTIILPSWKEGTTKKAIIQFVNNVTNKNSLTYVQPKERIATFDQDGTLWCEQPVAQLEFVSYQIKKMAKFHPEWKNKQPYKSILEGDKNYLINDYMNNHGKELIQLILTTHSGMTLSDFNSNVKDFMSTSLHPKYNKNYSETVYQPMIELLEYLRENEFKVYICSGGGNDFMRVFTEDTYGIVPENVIGSFAMSTYEQVDGSWNIVKQSENYFKNDGNTKPAAIKQRIGRIPIFVAGNVRSGGDIGQLTYSMTNPLPSFQLLINHDDAIREFAYSEKNNASLKAANEGKWTVVSMKNDWLKIFPFDAF